MIQKSITLCITFLSETKTIRKPKSSKAWNYIVFENHWKTAHFFNKVSEASSVEIINKYHLKEIGILKVFTIQKNWAKVSKIENKWHKWHLTISENDTFSTHCESYKMHYPLFSMFSEWWSGAGGRRRPSSDELLTESPLLPSLCNDGLLDDGTAVIWVISRKGNEEWLRFRLAIAADEVSEVGSDGFGVSVGALKLGWL